MQSDFVFKLARVAREVLSYEQEVNLEVREFTCFLKGGQIQHDFKNRATTFAFRMRIPDLCSHSSPYRSNDGTCVPVILVQESTEGTWAFDRCVLGSGIAVCFKERCHQGVEGLKLAIVGEEGLDGVEYGSGFFVHRTVSVLAGT